MCVERQDEVWWWCSMRREREKERPGQIVRTALHTVHLRDSSCAADFKRFTVHRIDFSLLFLFLFVHFQNIHRTYTFLKPTFYEPLFFSNLCRAKWFMSCFSRTWQLDCCNCCDRSTVSKCYIASMEFCVAFVCGPLAFWFGQRKFSINLQYPGGKFDLCQMFFEKTLLRNVPRTRI